MHQRDAAMHIPARLPTLLLLSPACAQIFAWFRVAAVIRATPVTLPLWRRAAQALGLRLQDFGFAAAPLAPRLHSDMNFLRSLPWTPLVSASFEHSSDAAVRGFSARFWVGAAFAAGAVVAGDVVCANAELIRNRDAIAVTAAREDIVIMVTPLR